jgi:hypothetical protein
MMAPAVYPVEHAVPPVTVRVAAPDLPRQGGGALRNLFQKATGLGIGGMMRRTLPETQPPAHPHHAAPTVRVEPSVAAAPSAAPVRPGPRTAAQQDEMGLEIPTFLRRQSN